MGLNFMSCEGTSFYDLRYTIQKNEKYQGTYLGKIFRNHPRSIPNEYDPIRVSYIYTSDKVILVILRQ